MDYQAIIIRSSTVKKTSFVSDDLQTQFVFHLIDCMDWSDTFLCSVTVH